MLTRKILLGVSFLLLTTYQTSATLHALQSTGYTDLTNDRFSAGFPSAPLVNSSPIFVGADMDWAGVGWAPGFVRKGFGFISPEHYLAAKHFGGSSTVTIFDQTGNLQTKTQSSVQNTTYGEIFEGQTIGDLSLGTLTEPMNDIPRYGVIDLNNASDTNTPNNYLALPLLVYGHGGNETNSTRVSAAQIEEVTVSGLQHRFLTSRNDVQLETYDSGSPNLADWTNPNDDPELAIIGNNAGINDTYNFHNFAGTHEVMSKLNELMNDDGRALHIVGDESNTWEGSSSTDIDRNSAWGIGGNPNAIGATSDKYVLFDPATASSLSATVDTDYNLRGLYFKSSGTSSDGFSFSGIATLTIGRGGITNYDNDTQNFSANLALSAPQYWSVKSGSLSLATLNNNGHLLEIGGSSGSSTVSGSISGSGGLALSEGTLTLNGTSSYTGPTWVHGGSLNVSGDISSSASLTLSTYGQLSGTGSTPALSGGGSISPGNSPGILTTTAVDPSEGLDFDFEFSAASAPDFTAPSASINDLLRITAATPFENTLTANNEISVYLDVASLSAGQQFLGGFFTDENTDFIDAIKNAQITTYLADPTGNVTFNGQTYSADTAPLRLVLSTILQTANFGSGPISGRILQLQVVDQTNYTDWKLYYNLSGNAALNTADTDDDGIAQLLEFAFGGNPNINDSSILPTHALVEDAGSSYLELTVTRPKDLQGITFTPLTTADLTSWPSDSIGIVDDSPTPSDNGNGTETLTYRRSQAAAGAEQAFLRVEISETP